MKNFRYSVALDVDDVLMSCIGLACELANKEYGLNPPITENDVKAWELDESEYDKYFTAYFSDPEFYKKQKPYDGAQEFVKKLSKKMEVFIVTAVHPNAMSVRIEQIRKFFPQIKPENIIPAYRKDIINVDFALDDRAHNILTSNAKYPVLFRRPWNKYITGVLSINSYDEFLNVVDCIKDSYAENTIGFSRPSVIALVGTSGSGKTSILNELIKYEKIETPVSATTRQKRPKEPNDNYHFISNDTFNQMKENGEFAETTMYAKHQYGTELASINKILKNGKHCIVAIDISGALALKMQYRTSIFYIKRDRDKTVSNIIQRLIDGKANKDDTVNRICSLDDEKKNEEIADYIIENNSTLDVPVSEIAKILKL